MPARRGGARAVAPPPRGPRDRHAPGERGGCRRPLCEKSYRRCTPSRRAEGVVASLCGMPLDPSLVLMTMAALHPRSVRSLATSPHRGLVEGAPLLSLYGVYELIRGGGHTTLALARHHTDSIVSRGRPRPVFGERSLQQPAHATPAAPAVLGFAYMALHFGLTIGFLFWM